MMRILCAFLLTMSYLGSESSAFLVTPTSTSCRSSSTAQFALWRHFVPQSKQLPLIVEDHVKQVDNKQAIDTPWAAAMLLTLILTLPWAAYAVSGGGLDYANLDITGQDFSKGNYKGKDFTQVIAKGTNFAFSNLQGCRFYKAFLVSE